MEIITIIVVSAIVSIIIGNIIGTYYLKENDNKWKEVFHQITEITINEVKKIKK
ncbi:MAG: hypothetical protein ACLRVU_09565 [Beduini sp.]|uniref:hypothetical protein n=1 Tax=Beduini sp. TaxID=1922300 RepID=UPI00399F4968